MCVAYFSILKDKDRPMTEDEFLIKYRKFLQGECSAEEIAELHEYRDDMELEDGEWEPGMGGKAGIRKEISARLHESMNADAGVKVRKISPTVWKAAAIICGLAVGLYYFQLYRGRYASPAGQFAAHHTTGKKEKKIYLTLANGKVISLTDADNGRVSITSGVEANKQNDGELAYKPANVPASAAAPEINTISTPFGEQFSVTLADGSKVRLNAASSIRFPVYFSSSKREVYLSGEAFFEVAANPASPFIVHVNGVEVQALGTTFNIKAYPEEKVAKATLLTGAVNVKWQEEVKQLATGQQFGYDRRNSRTWLRNVNTAAVTGWKDGYFAFEKESIADIMMEIGRWYNMEVVFSKGDMYKRFSGKILRYDHIQDVFKRLELTGAMNFRIENKKIVVTIP